MTVLMTIGVEMPEDFPTDALWRTHERVMAHKEAAESAWVECAAGWSGLAYRFLACDARAATFEKSLAKHGTAPPSEERSKQEDALFAFFVSGLSALQCFGYGLHAVAWMTEGDFTMDTEKQRRNVTLTHTARRLQTHFASDEVAACLDSMLNSRDYRVWRELRNLLAHRAAPARSFALGLPVGADAAPVTGEWGLA